MKIVLTALSITLLLISTQILAKSSSRALDAELAEAQQRINKINASIPQAEISYAKASSNHDLAKKELKRKRKVFDKSKDKYEKASRNTDIVPLERIQELLGAYSQAKKAYQKADQQLKNSEKEQHKSKNKLSVIKQRRVSTGIEILNIKSRIYESKLKQAIWVEGRGECILGESKTIRECQKLARSYAEQNAIERGSKAFIETLTEIKDFELVKDEIKKSSSVIIVKQDNSGDYGKIKRSIVGDVIKYYVTIRLKIEGVVGHHNPFKEKIRQLKIAHTEDRDDTFLNQTYNERSVIAFEQEPLEIEPPTVKRIERRERAEAKEEQFIPLPSF